MIDREKYYKTQPFKKETIDKVIAYTKGSGMTERERIQNIELILFTAERLEISPEEIMKIISLYNFGLE